jgi:hypothetical protein
MTVKKISIGLKIPMGPKKSQKTAMGFKKIQWG